MSWEVLVGVLLVGLVLGFASRRPHHEPAQIVYVEREQPQGGGCLPLLMFVVGLVLAAALLDRLVSY